MNIIYNLLLTFLLIFSTGFSFTVCAEIAKSDSCSKDEVRKYLNTVDEFYGAIQALYSDSSFKLYPAFYNALDAASTMSKNTESRALSNTIKTLYGTIEGAYKEYTNQSGFISLAKPGMDRITSQMNSISTKVEKWKKSGCKDKKTWECYLGIYGTPCNPS